MKAIESFSKRLSLHIIGKTSILLLGAVAVIGLLSYITIYKSSVRDSSRTLENSLKEIEIMLTDIEAGTNSSVWLIEKFHDNEEAVADIIGNLIVADTNIVSCEVGFEPLDGEAMSCVKAFFNDAREVEVQRSNDTGYDYLAMDWYLIPKLLEREYWSEPSFDSEGSGKLVASYSKPLYYKDGSFCGVIKADIGLDDLMARLYAIKPYENSYTVLAGRDASYIAHKDRDKVLRETLFTTAFQAKDENLLEMAQDMVAGKSGDVRFKLDGEHYLAVYSHLTNGWSGALVSRTDDVIFGARMMSLISLLIAILSCIVLYLSNKRIINRESQPITALAYSALSIAQGNFKARIPEVRTKDELRRLHDSFSYLEKSIDSYISELRASTASNERFESELNIASAIQMQMLPKDFPKYDEIDLYATLHPAREVGGDLYDFFVKDRMLYFCVGDVSGKGVPAALYMAITRSSFRFIAGLCLPVDGVVTRINNAFCDGNDSGMFVTMFVGRIDLDTLKMDFCNAGHNPILYVSAAGEPRYLHATPNLAAGLFEDFPYKGESLQLEKGSRLLIYTDGVTEAEDAEKNLYGENRLEDFARAEDVSVDSHDFINDLVADLKAFTKKSPQNDDITIMSIKL